MASFNPNAPDCDFSSYESYLAEQIKEEEILLKNLQDKYHVAAIEEQLFKLRIKSAKLDDQQFRSTTSKGLVTPASPTVSGIAATMLAIAQG